MLCINASIILNNGTIPHFRSRFDFFEIRQFQIRGGWPHINEALTVTIFIGLMSLAGFMLWRKKLFEARWLLWPLMLIAPLAYIANLAGWYTAELGRQPWLVYDLMRTAEGASPNVSAGNTLFTLLGFVGLYMLLGLLFLLLTGKIIHKGPQTLQH